IHTSGEQVTSVRENVKRETSNKKLGTLSDTDKNSNTNDLPVSRLTFHDSRFTIHDKIPWTKYGYYLSERPSFTFDPLFHAGCYYVQDASSMFLEQAFRQLTELSQPMKVLDLCGAPGGKSTHIQSLISDDSLLVSNEVIKGRSHILIDNIVKWGAANVIVTNNDPNVFGSLEGYFDVMVVDAPCSGSGLFRKDREAINEWSLNNVQLCSQRQKRILADALPALKENGLLVYSTCSYSTEEDEDMADWLVDEMGMQNEALNIDEGWKIVTTKSKKSNAEGYRFYPDKLKGEGFFLACFRKQYSTEEPRIRPAKIEKASAKERSIIIPWLKPGKIEIIKERDRYIALPEHLIGEFTALRTVLNTRYAGVSIGQIMKEKLVPEHALALSQIISAEIPSNDLSYDEAIKYLQRQDMNFNRSGKGWQLVKYQGYNLGWINVLPNRINNYYPKEMRILKSTYSRSFEK
ncbi:MAG: methyltransferase RsmF C-terminal domain-like protein, partial [Flavisolibacter sp.]